MPWLAACTAPAAMAAGRSTPSKPVTMVVPFPPGGVADTVGRPVAEAMNAHLQPAGRGRGTGPVRGGGIGMAHVAKSRADGYTVLMALSSLVVLPEADRMLGRPPMFRIDQLQPVARFAADPTVLVVRADSPWKTFAEFVADVKANPGRRSFGSSGNYGTMHVPMEQLKAATATFMLHVPYTGKRPGHLWACSAVRSWDAVAGGPPRVRRAGSKAPQVARTGAQRAKAAWRLLPDVPSFGELGTITSSTHAWSRIFNPGRHTTAAGGGQALR
ncbi:MAG: tripartite tricarboxylate transporter substrate binding protein [Agrobacterium sp.]|nr:tripartite tricarboxylate transporter substrate binding protein [Agrobacterium sp.]